MNIMHVVDMISQLRGGGSAKVPYQLGEWQARHGHKVTIFTSDYNANNEQPPQGVAMVKFHCWLNLLGGVRITPEMWYADYGKFDIIHLHNYRTFVNIVVASKGKPCIMQAHGSAAPMKARLTKPLHNYLWRKRIMSRCSAFIADADMEIEQYVAEGADRSNITVIPVGINASEFKSRAEINHTGKKRILFLGRLHKNKGPDILVKAFNLLKHDDAVLSIAGYDDGFEYELADLISKSDKAGRIEYIGACYGQAKVRAYNSAAVYVMPSRRELFGLTLLEALACGTPVIISDKCGAAPLLPKECGVAVPLDEYALAEAIDKALDDNVAMSYRQYRRQWAQQFDWDNIAPRIMNVYEGVLNG